MFKTFYGVLREAARWLVSVGSPTWRWRPPGSTRCRSTTPCRARGLREGAGVQRRACEERARVARPTWPTRSGWRSCWSAGCSPGSFIPPAHIKAARDVHPLPGQDRPAADLSEIARLGNVLQDAGHQDRLRGLVDHHQVRAADDRGADRRGAPPAVLAELAIGRMRRRSRTCDGAGGPLRRAPRADVPAAPGHIDHLDGDDREAGRADRGDDGSPFAPPATC